MLRIVIPGRAVPAVRMTQKSKFANKQAQRYMSYKEQVGWQTKVQLPRGFQLLTGDVAVMIKVYLMPIPSHEGDWDNYGKSICDSLKGIVWRDDIQVWKGDVEKVVDEGVKERVEFEIYTRAEWEELHSHKCLCKERGCSGENKATGQAM